MGGIAEMLYTGENRPRLGNAVYGLFGRDFTTRHRQRKMIVVVPPPPWAHLIAALNIGEAVAAVEAARDRSLANDDRLRSTHPHQHSPQFHPPPPDPHPPQPT